MFCLNLIHKLTTRQVIDGWLEGNIKSDDAYNELESRLDGLQDAIGVNPDNCPNEDAEYNLILDTLLTISCDYLMELE